MPTSQPEHGPGRQDPSALRALQAIQLLNDALDGMHGDLTRRMEMHASDLRALRMLSIREQQRIEVTPHELAEHLAITTAAATSLIDRLVAQGFAERRRHPKDGRSRIITLTDAARRHFFAHFGDHLQAMNGLVLRRSPEELETISGFLEDLAESLTETQPGIPENNPPKGQENP